MIGCPPPSPLRPTAGRLLAHEGVYTIQTLPTDILTSAFGPAQTRHSILATCEPAESSYIRFSATQSARARSAGGHRPARKPAVQHEAALGVERANGERKNTHIHTLSLRTVH